MLGPSNQARRCQVSLFGPSICQILQYQVPLLIGQSMPGPVMSGPAFSMPPPMTHTYATGLSGLAPAS